MEPPALEPNFDSTFGSIAQAFGITGGKKHPKLRIFGGRGEEVNNKSWYSYKIKYGHFN